MPHPPRRNSAPAAIPPSYHGHNLRYWPLRNTLILGAATDTVPLARTHLRHLLAGWGHAELSPDASVVVCELVTNSVEASAELGPAAAPVLVWLGSDGHCLLLAVADASPQPPARPNLGPDAERGRGLTLVEALSSRWGWHPASATGLRKVTWAEWRLPSAASQQPGAGLPAPDHQLDQREQRSILGLLPPKTANLTVNVPCQDH